VISALSAGPGPQSGTFVVSWLTTVPATTQVVYGLGPRALYWWVTNSALTTGHKELLHVAPHSLYYFYVHSTTSAGSATSPIYSVMSQ
jgi:hypothetical protein